MSGSKYISTLRWVVAILLVGSRLAWAVNQTHRPAPTLFYPVSEGAAPSHAFCLRLPAMRAHFDLAGVTLFTKSLIARIEHLGKNQSVSLDGTDREPVGANFLVGPPSGWKWGVPAYKGVVYRDLYTGIDLHYQVGDRLKAEYHLIPGADHRLIRTFYSGVGTPAVSQDGSLVFRSADGELREEAPVVYQQIRGSVVRIPAAYRVYADGTVGFDIGDYDRQQPLVIDPELSMSSFVGGSGFDAVTSVASDSSGNTYFAGWTESADLPVSGQQSSRPAGGIDAFVGKLAPSGALLYLTYFGGRANDHAYGIAVDLNGNVAITGSTESDNFPLVAPFQASLRGLRDAFLLKVNPAGDRILLSTYLGGSKPDSGRAVAFDFVGNVYLAGDTFSADFPTHSPFQAVLGGGQDAFLVKTGASGSLAFSSYLGGTGDDFATGVAVDTGGAVYTCGGTQSANFPIQGALQPALGGGQDAFVTKFHPSGTSLIYSTYLGGSQGSPGTPEFAAGLAVNASGEAYISGTTSSVNFPVRNPRYSRLAGGSTDAFVAKLNALGSSLSYSTFLGGSGLDMGGGIAVDRNENAYIVGYTASPDFPVVDAVQSNHAGLYDVFLTQLSAGGNLVLFSTYLGGRASDSGSGVAVDDSNVIHLGGMTLSDDFRLRSQFQSQNLGNYGGFVARMKAKSPPSLASAAPSSGSGTSLAFTFDVLDSDGGATVDWVHVVFNSQFNLSNACYFAYQRIGNFLYLANDSASATQGTVNLGGGGSVQNSNCMINAAGSSSVVSGATLKLTVSVLFKPAFAGVKSIYATASDNTGLSSGWQTVGAWTVSSVVQTPTLSSLSPSTGSGASQTFTFTFSDADGASTITWAHIVINSTLSAAQGCYFAYEQARSLLYIANDSATATQATIGLGAGGSVQNSQCVIHAANSSVAVLGNNLSLTVSLSFKPAFAGTKSIYATASDNAGLSSVWQNVGTWTIPFGSQAPTVKSVSPTAGAGSSQTFTFVFADPDGASTMTWAHIIVNASLTTPGACYFAFERAQNLLYLANDAATATQATIRPGAAASIENSQCAIHAATSASNSSGSDLVLSVSLSFKPAFSGAKSVYAAVFDTTGGGSGWQKPGAWTVP